MTLTPLVLTSKAAYVQDLESLSRTSGASQLQVCEDSIVRDVGELTMVVLLDHHSTVLAVFDSRAYEVRSCGPTRSNMTNKYAIVATLNHPVESEISGIESSTADSSSYGKGRTSDVGNFKIGNRIPPELPQ